MPPAPQRTLIHTRPRIQRPAIILHPSKYFYFLFFFGSPFLFLQSVDCNSSQLQGPFPRAGIASLVRLIPWCMGRIRPPPCPGFPPGAIPSPSSHSFQASFLCFPYFLLPSLPSFYLNKLFCKPGRKSGRVVGSTGLHGLRPTDGEHLTPCSFRNTKLSVAKKKKKKGDFSWVLFIV